MWIVLCSSTVRLWSLPLQFLKKYQTSLTIYKNINKVAFSGTTGYCNEVCKWLQQRALSTALCIYFVYYID